MAQETAHPWRRVLKRRIAITAAGLALWSCAIEARLVYLQVFQHADLMARAERQQMRTVPAPAKRGEILDRRGRLLAYSVDADSIYAVPTEIENSQTAAASLCGALQDCAPKEQETLAGKFGRQRAFAYVRRQVTPDQSERVRALQLDGIGFMSESRRFYPNKELAAHLLGYVGLDSDGLSGIEGTYDSLIKGRAGAVLVQTDAKRHAFSRLERPPTTGATLELTIDEYLQHVAERELSRGVETAGAAGGSAVVMNPGTGEILAMANYPTFNPNAYRDFQDDQRRNRAVEDLYEPGSTFKIVTASAALEEHVLQPDAMIDTSPGSIHFGSRVIYDDKHENHGVISFTDVIVESSNVGAIRIGLKVGAERMSTYVRRYGFGHPSSPDFRGESPGLIWPGAKLTDSALASMSMGYQVAVTPLQMVRAVSAVANGGTLVQPRVVRAVVRDGQRKLVPHQALGQVINRETAAALTTIMEKVVTDGTGKRARIDGFTVAGKTGTAQKVENGAYSKHDYNVSFVGFVPSRQPAFAIVVVVDSPCTRGPKAPCSPYGGFISAPIFQRIAEAAIRYQGVAPSINRPPPLLAERPREQPDAPVIGPARPPAIVAVSGHARGGDSVFPDLRGMSARDALHVVAQLGMSTRLRGAGLVVNQEPEPGTAIERGTESTLWLQREPLALASNRRQP